MTRTGVEIAEMVRDAKRRKTETKLEAAMELLQDDGANGCMDDGELVAAAELFQSDEHFAATYVTLRKLELRLRFLRRRLTQFQDPMPPTFNSGLGPGQQNSWVEGTSEEGAAVGGAGRGGGLVEMVGLGAYVMGMGLMGPGEAGRGVLGTGGGEASGMETNEPRMTELGGIGFRLDRFGAGGLGRMNGGH